MKNIFEEFDKTSSSEWIDKITSDLKGKSIDVLKSFPEMDFEINAFHHKDNSNDIPSPIHKSSNSWGIRKSFTKDDNKEILKNLNEGVDCIGLNFSTEDAFKKQIAGIQFEYLNSDVRFDSLNSAMLFKGHPTNKLNFDIFSLGIQSGSWQFSKEDYLSFYNAQQEYKSIWISGSTFGEAGATTIQELAFTANQLNEYIQLLVDAGKSLEEINEKIIIELSVNENYFVNIGKFRVIRNLVNTIFSAYDENYKPKPVLIYAKTSSRYLAQNDSNNNLLRETTQAMSAILGGCDILTVQPYLSADTGQNDLNNRMAKNIQIVLKEEAYFDKVVDPSSGSYYIENLCAELTTKSWKLFKEIESQGGLVACVESEDIQNHIIKNINYLVNNMNEGKQTFLGVNKFPSRLEEWANVDLPEHENYGAFKSLNPFNLESHFKSTVDK